MLSNSDFRLLQETRRITANAERLLEREYPPVEPRLSPEQEGLRAMAEAGVPLSPSATRRLPEPRDVNVAEMTNDAKAAFMREAKVPWRESDPDDVVAQMREAQETRVRAVELMSERVGVPLKYSYDLRDTVKTFRALGEDMPEPASPIAVLREARVPTTEPSPAEPPPHELVRDLDEAIPDGHPDRGTVGYLRKQGAALSTDHVAAAHRLAASHARALERLRARRAAEPDTDDMSEAGVAAIREAGVPVISEASAASGSGALMPAHEVVRDLHEAIPDDHEDRDRVEQLRRHGAALAAQDLEEVQKLADTHSEALDDLRRRRALDDTAKSVDGLREQDLEDPGREQRPAATTATEMNSGFAIKQPGESATSLSDPLHESQSERALIEAGVPLKTGSWQ